MSQINRRQMFLSLIGLSAAAGVTQPQVIDRRRAGRPAVSVESQLRITCDDEETRLAIQRRVNSVLRSLPPGGSFREPWTYYPESYRTKLAPGRHSFYTETSKLSVEPSEA